MLTRRFGAVAFLWLGLLAGPVGAQEVAELIRQRVEELTVVGTLAVVGEPIASRQLLPRLYEQRAFAPTWRSLEQVDSLLALIDQSYGEGLDPNDYHAAAIRTARASLADLDGLPPAERAALDIVLTDAVIRLGYHLRFGKVDPVALDPHWNLSRDLMGQDAAVTIQAAIDSAALPEFAAEAIPRVFLYERFAKALAYYRTLAAAGGWPRVPEGATLKLGMNDDRVPVLAARLAITGDLPAEVAQAATSAYDEAIVTGVQNFQVRHGLTADGAVGRGTLAALNVPVEARIEQLRANLERARWVSFDPESEFLVVNIAGFRLYIVRRGEVVYRTRVQVGRPYRQTPVFQSEMKYLVFNPTWTVPPTIFREDLLPQLRRNSSYLMTRGIDLFDASGMPVDPITVDWRSRSLPYRLVQAAGPNNALGRVKFMFPNDHAVYLHDTPSQDLFTRDNRAFSSGCIRVENPLELAEILLGRSWSRERIDTLIATGRTQTVFLDKPMPLMLLYWTAEVDAEGKVLFFPDVYERDAAVIKALAEPFDARNVL
jgi:murein L,D-transpeptidase YcbB/YkuD